jgi:surface antigen-like variable number repeat protein
VHRSFAWFLLLVLLLPASTVEAQSRASPKIPLTEADFSQEVKVAILRVEFPRDFPLSEDIRTKIEQEIRSQDINTDPMSPDSEWWVENYVDWRIREELRSQGYFKANVHSRPHLVLAKADKLEYIVAVEAEPGAQYRLGELRFRRVVEHGTLRVKREDGSASEEDFPESEGFSRSFTAVTLDELQGQFKIHPGDILKVSKIREGLEGIESLYGRIGYIDVTSEPDTTVNDKRHLIGLVVTIDEGIQYHAGKIEIIGLDPKNAAPLESLLEPGQVYSKESFEKLLDKSKPLLPAGFSPERIARVTRNVVHGTIDIVLDFRGCHEE